MVLLCTMRIGSPCSANSVSQKVRARKPRSSALGSTSIRNAPSSGVGLKIKDGAPDDRSGHPSRHPRRDAPAELVIEPASLLKLLHAVDPEVPASCEPVEGEPVPLVCPAELLHAPTDRPQRLGGRKHRHDLGAVDLIRALVRPGPRG